MKNVFINIVLIFLFPVLVNSQVSSYTFSASSGSYSAIAGGTVLIDGSSSMDSWASSAITIPAFTYNCVSYTTVYVTSNGQLSFGGSAPSAYSYDGVSGGVGSGLCLCPFSADLNARYSNASSNIRWQTVGSEVIFQWTGMCRYAQTEDFDFQIRLNTSNGVIRFVYRLNSGPGSGESYQPQVGIRTSSTDYKNIRVGTGAETWASPLPGASNTDICRFTSTAVAKSFTSGLTYTFTPPPSCSGTPAPGNTIASSNPVCSNAPLTLSMSTPPSGCGTSYQWQSSPDNSTWTNITGATSITYSATQSSATYYRCRVTCSNSGLSANSTSVYVTMSPPATCHCIPSGTSSSRYINNFSTTGGSTNITNNNTGYSPSGYGTYMGLTATQMQNNSINFSITGDGSGTYGFAIWVDWNQDGDFNDIGEQVFVTSGYSTSTSGSFTVPLTATPGNTKMRVTANYLNTAPSDPCATGISGEFEDYTFCVTALPACAGTPAGGTANASPTNGCPGYSTTITVTGATIASGLTYQWQSSPDNVTWTNIPGATGLTYSTVVSSEIYFRRITTCTNSGISSNSSVVHLTVNSFIFCYCNSSATSTSDMDITNVTFGTINNTSATVSLTGTQGTATGTAGMYSDWRSSTVPKPNFMQGSTNTFSVTIGGSAYSHRVNVYIDFNHDGDFNDPGEEIQVFAYANPTLPNTTSTSITIPINAVTGNTLMRVVCVESSSISSCGTYSWGETEDYIINITAAPPCSGTPAGGTANASPSSGCPGYSTTLTVTGATIATGLTYQWQSSPDNITWTNIPGATDATYSTTINSNLYFRRITTCTISGNSANSTNVNTTVNNFLLCYCNSSATSTSDMDITNVTFGTINNTSATVSLTGTQGTATGTAGMYSDWRSSTVPKPNFMQGSTNTFSVTIGGTAYSHRVTVYIDFNHDGDFNDPGEEIHIFQYANPSLPNTTTKNITIPLSAAIGNTVMRVVCVESSSVSCCGTYTWGETEDYIINITAAPPCSGTPTGGTANATTTSVSGCTGYAGAIYITGSTAATGLTYQWYSAPTATGPWTLIPGATGDTYTPTTTGLYYRRQIICTASGGSAYSSALLYTSSAPANDECENATTLTVNTTSTCTTTSPGTVKCATESPQLSSCTSGTYDDDVWFKFVATKTEHSISILNASGSTTDMYFSVYKGNCGSLTNIACSDNDNLTLGYLTIGDTYYIRVYTYTSTPGQNTTFNVCVSVPAASSVCSGGRPFCSDTTYVFPTNVNSGTAPAGISYGCLCSQPNPIWYYMKVGVAGPMELTIQSSCGDVDYAAWGPFSTIACDSLTDSGIYNYGSSTSSSCSVANFASPSGSMVDCAYSAASTETLTIPYANVNTYYIVMINNYANCSGTYTFRQSSGTGNADCNIVPLPVGLFSINGNCVSENEIKIDWTTFTQLNNDYFEIQRMINGEFVTMGVVKGAGNSNELLTYSYTDYINDNNVQYYKLRQVDFDGTISDLKIITVDCNGDLIFDINSASLDALSGTLEIDFSGMAYQDYDIKLMDLTGKIIYSNKYTATNDGKNLAVMYFKPMAQGIYVVSLTNKSGITKFSKVSPK